MPVLPFSAAPSAPLLIPLTVDRQNPPAYAVTVCQGPEDTTQTLAFATLHEAERAYAAACLDKRDTMVLCGAKGQETVLVLVALWRRQQGQTISGEPSLCYEDITPNGGLPEEFGLSERRCEGCGHPYDVCQGCYHCRPQATPHAQP